MATRAQKRKIAERIAKELTYLIYELSQENLDEKKDWEDNPHQITDTGALADSGRVYSSHGVGEVAYRLFYADYIEYGTRPHPVGEEGIKQIKKWAKRKLGLSDKKAERAAYAIANKIRREGTEPRPYLRNATEQALRELPKRLRAIKKF